MDGESIKATGQRAPAFQFYPRDYMSDIKVRLMSHEQKGIYVDLLCLDWDEDGIPQDVEDLALLTGLEPARFRAHWEKRIACCFVEHPTKLRFLTSKRLEVERTKQRLNSEKAKASADARWDVVRRERERRAQEIADAMRPHSAGNATASPEQSEGNALRSSSSSSKRTTTSAPKSGAADKATWMTPYFDGYRDARGAKAVVPTGPMSKVVKKIHDEHGGAETLAEFKVWLKKTPVQFENFHKFGSGFGTWSAKKLDSRAAAMWEQLDANLEEG